METASKIGKDERIRIIALLFAFMLTGCAGDRMTAPTTERPAGAGGVHR
jgi:hypothetical protein